MLTAYNVALLGDDEAAPSTQPQAGEPTLGVDISCTDQNVCTPMTEVAKVQIQSLQSALNRAATFFKIDMTPLDADGTIGPATLTAAIKIANIVGADASPIFAEITAVDPMDAASVRALAERLATAPVTIQQAFDAVTGTAQEATAQAQASHAKRMKVIWIVLGALLIAGAAAGTVYYVRKNPQLVEA